MYQGFGKGDGGIVGSIADEDAADASDFAEVCDSASAEESLVCNTIDDSGNPCKIVVSARLCSKSGRILWERELDETAVMQRTVGMSQMTSMLHDKDRNSVYERAIKKSIDFFSQHCSRSPVILDIGTGTGLLAMFAARHGADLVIGCEMFETMAAIAEEVVNDNGYGGTVNVIPIKSSSIESLSPVVPDILVSELLDSALLGEACMYAHGDAIARFMESIASQEGEDKQLPISQRVMPHSAIVYGTLIQSDEVRRMHDVSDVRHYGDSTPWRDESARDCAGGWPLIPLHWREFEGRGASKLSEPTPVLTFEFFHSLAEMPENIASSTSAAMETEDNDDEDDEDTYREGYVFGEACFQTDIVATSDGVVHAVLLWWRVQLLSPEIDPSRECFYSTEPGAMNWQDHWQQCVFPLPRSIECSKGDVIRVTAAHDALRIWLKAEMVVDLTPSTSGGAAAGAVTASDIRLEGVEDSNAKRFKASEPSQEKGAIGSQLLAIAPVPPSERLLPAQCTCGWHLLCGAERIQALTDKNHAAAWELALEGLIARIATKSAAKTSSVGGDIKADQQPVEIVLDVCDGSMLAIAAAMKLKGQSSIKVVSTEKKMFSRMFHAQLMEANDLSDVAMVWEGEDWSDIVAYFTDQPDDDDDGEDDASGGNEEADSPLPVGKVEISALIGECFYYQLHALPTWQAICFHYQRTALDALLAENAVILPARALVMVAAVELTDLAGTFGAAGVVSGFDHAALDRQQENWHKHKFPYKLAGYRKKLLSEPVVAATLQYANKISDIPEVNAAVPMLTAGRCDAVAIWVDYDLNLSPSYSDKELAAGNGNSLRDDGRQDMIRHWDGTDFPCHYKLSLKFFPKPMEVTPASTLAAKTSFRNGESDFDFDFSIL